jgi:hypothetical protein
LSPASSSCLQSPCSFSVNSPSPPPTTADFSEFLQVMSHKPNYCFAWRKTHKKQKQTTLGFYLQQNFTVFCYSLSLFYFLPFEWRAHARRWGKILWSTDLSLTTNENVLFDIKPFLPLAMFYLLVWFVMVILMIFLLTSFPTTSSGFCQFICSRFF